jgi:hypothetical protein
MLFEGNRGVLLFVVAGDGGKSGLQPFRAG